MRLWRRLRAAAAVWVWLNVFVCVCWLHFDVRRPGTYGEAGQTVRQSQSQTCKTKQMKMKKRKKRSKKGMWTTLRFCVCSPPLHSTLTHSLSFSFTRCIKAAQYFWYLIAIHTKWAQLSIISMQEREIDIAVSVMQCKLMALDSLIIGAREVS